MKSLAFAALAPAAAAISIDEREFANFTARFNKVYGDIKEFALRFENFIYWNKVIKEHNNTNSANIFTLNHNQFSDWTGEEYLAILGYRQGGSANEKNIV